MRRPSILVLSPIIFLCLFHSPSGVARGDMILSTIASFNGTNGTGPYGGVTRDAQGNLYGTTSSGGANGDGTVFELANSNATVPEPTSIVALGQALAIAGVGLAVRARSRRARVG